MDGLSFKGVYSVRIEFQITSTIPSLHSYLISFTLYPMRQATIITFLFLVLFLTGCISSKPIPPVSEGTIRKKNPADWGSYTLDNKYLILNNVWNKSKVKKYKQTIYLFDEDGSRVIGWDWKWPYGLDVRAYPEIIYGQKPWDQPYGLESGFPFFAGEKKITVEYDLKIHATGVYNMAFSLWATKDNPGTISGISHEIMIWVVNHGMGSWGKKSGSIEVNGTTFDLFIYKGHGDASGTSAQKWKYIAFIARKSKLSGPLEISDFISFLLEKNVIEKNHYITCLELGTEIIHGQGSVGIRNYDVKVY